MKSRHWEISHIIRSRLLPEAFFGAAYPEWDINRPEQTFSGFTYAIEVASEHKGWDHFIGILYKKRYPAYSTLGISQEDKDTEMMIRMKSSLAGGTYQFMLNLYTLPGISAAHASLFELPIDEPINFYVRPYLINPSSQGIYYLWDQWDEPFGLRGFPVGMPGAIDRESLPFLSAN